MATINFFVPAHVREAYREVAEQREVPLKNLYAAALEEALDLGLVSTVPCQGRKPRAKETKPRSEQVTPVGPVTC